MIQFRLQLSHSFFQSLDFLPDRVRQFLHGLGIRIAHLNHATGHADNSDVRRHRSYDHRAGADFGTIADGDSADNFRAGADDYIIAQCGMPFLLQ